MVGLRRVPMKPPRQVTIGNRVRARYVHNYNCRIQSSMRLYFQLESVLSEKSLPNSIEKVTVSQ